MREDSVPKDRKEIQILKESKKWGIKTKNGIADDLEYLKKERAMASVSTTSIYYKRKDPFEEAEMLAQANGDSSIVVPKRDSLGIYLPGYDGEIITNIDQMIYLRHFGHYLHYPDETQSVEGPLVEEESTEGEKKEKKGLFGFLKRKKKSTTELTEGEEGIDSDTSNYDEDVDNLDKDNGANYNTTDEDNSEDEVNEKPKKKGLFGKLRKKKNKDKEEIDPEEEDQSQEWGY